MSVPEHLSLELRGAGASMEAALPVLELIEQRASRAGVAVDSRIERGRTRTGTPWRRCWSANATTSLVVPARTSTADGFEPADVAWLLENAARRGLVLRPEPARA